MYVLQLDDTPESFTGVVALNNYYSGCCRVVYWEGHLPNDPATRVLWIRFSIGGPDITIFGFDETETIDDVQPMMRQFINEASEYTQAARQFLSIVEAGFAATLARALSKFHRMDVD